MISVANMIPPDSVFGGFQVPRITINWTTSITQKLTARPLVPLPVPRRWMVRLNSRNLPRLSTVSDKDETRRASRIPPERDSHSNAFGHKQRQCYKDRLICPMVYSDALHLPVLRLFCPLQSLWRCLDFASGQPCTA